MDEAMTTEQQKANRKLWVDALRSGKYQQGRAVLRGMDNTYCCLGVACDIAGMGWTPAGTRFETVEPTVRYELLPESVVNFLGLQHPSASYGETALWKQNDGAGFPRLSFAELADIIESEPDGLFAA